MQHDHVRGLTIMCHHTSLSVAVSLVTVTSWMFVVVDAVAFAVQRCTGMAL